MLGVLLLDCILRFGNGSGRVSRSIFFEYANLPCVRRRSLRSIIMIRIYGKGCGSVNVYFDIPVGFSRIGFTVKLDSLSKVFAVERLAVVCNIALIFRFERKPAVLQYDFFARLYCRFLVGG